MQFDMSQANHVSNVGCKKYNNDDMASMSSVSSIGVNSSFDSSDFEEEHGFKSARISPFNKKQDEGERQKESRHQVHYNFWSDKSGCDETDLNKSTSNNTSFSLTDDEWTTQKTATTGSSFYTGYTDTTGTTKLHKNGVSATLHRKLRRNNSCREEPVPTSINTIRRPMSFDYGTSAGEKQYEILAPSQLESRINYQKKIFSNKRLKDNPGSNYNDDRSCNTDTIAENGDYHAGSGSFSSFFRNFFLCCNPDSVL